MARYQMVVCVGAAILGKVGGEMMFTDMVVASRVLPWWQGVTGAMDGVKAYSYLQISVEAVLVVTIFLVGWLRRKK
jgi:predicted tellurium resistance membrane protein TerC